jgi:hypothetical protein
MTEPSFDVCENCSSTFKASSQGETLCDDCRDKEEMTP